MKQTSIEQLAETYTNKIVEVAYHNFPLVPTKESVSKVITVLLVEYTNQCQEDMADKKYTEEDMMLIRNQLVNILPVGDVTAWDMLQSVSKYIKWFDEYINSLNKQD